MADESQRVPQQTHPKQGGSEDPNRQMDAKNQKAMEDRDKRIEESHKARTPDGSKEDATSNAIGGILGGSKVLVPPGLHDGPTKDAPFASPRHNGGEWATPSKSKASSASSSSKE